MKKYKYMGLMIEFTRKCNLHCIHCMRGEAQNVTITKEIIDRIIESVEDCLRFQFTGGEPLLALDEIDYFINRVIEKDYQCEEIRFVTNGTIRDSRVIEVLSKFCNHRDNNKVTISISNDQFHNAEESRKTFEFYKKLTESIPTFSIEISNDKLGTKEDNTIIDFVVTGRAKNMSPEQLPEYTSKESAFDHRICIGKNGEVKDWVICGIEISSNGNVIFPDQRSFETEDRMALGNIMEESLYDIITKHNANCLINCSDVSFLERVQNIRNLTMFDREKIEFLNKSNTALDHYLFEIQCDILVEIIMRVIKARELAHRKWPAIPAQDIIETLTFYDSDVFTKCGNILNNSDPMDIIEMTKVLFSLPTLESADSMEQAYNALTENEDYDRTKELENAIKILALLKKPGAKIAMHKFWGDGDIFSTKEFKKLAKLNDEYTSGKRQFDNTKVLCNPNVDPSEIVANGFSIDMIAKTVNSPEFTMGLHQLSDYVNIIDRVKKWNKGFSMKS